MTRKLGTTVWVDAQTSHLLESVLKISTAKTKTELIRDALLCYREHSQK